MRKARTKKKKEGCMHKRGVWSKHYATYTLNCRCGYMVRIEPLQAFDFKPREEVIVA